MHINISHKEMHIAFLVTCTLSENKVSDIIDNVHVQILFTSLSFNEFSHSIHNVNVQVSIQMLFIVFMLMFQYIFS